MHVYSLVLTAVVVWLGVEALLLRTGKRRYSLLLPLAHSVARLLRYTRSRLRSVEKMVVDQFQDEDQSANEAVEREQFSQLLTELGVKDTHEEPQEIRDRQRGQRTFGQKAADIAASFCGSWTFISLYMAFTILWCGGNMFMWSFDRYPYQFYTFSVSVLAILMSALLLLAGNRQAEIDRAHAENAYRQIRQTFKLIVRVLKTLLEHSGILVEQTTILREQNDYLTKHSDVLEEQTGILNDQTALANQQHEKLAATVESVREELGGEITSLKDQLSRVERLLQQTLAEQRRNAGPPDWYNNGGYH